MTTSDPTREIVLVLGGGGIRGFAHIGVLRACAQLELTVRGIVGSSVGALVGAFAAAGRSVEEMAELALRLRKRDMFDIDYRALLVRQHRARSLYRGRGLVEFLEQHLPARTFSELELPLLLNAVNINTGALVCFGLAGTDDVPLHDAVRASTALPGFFPPVRIGTDDYMDGGVLDPLPLLQARALRGQVVHHVDGVPVTLRGHRAGPVVVAIHLEEIHTDRRVETPASMFGLLDRSETIRSQIAVQRNLEACGDLPLILVSPDVADRSIFDFREIGEVVAAGETATLATLTDHPLLFGVTRRRSSRGERKRSDTREIEVPS